MADGVVLSDAQFKQRGTQILPTYGQQGEGGSYSYLEKLIAGMPKRLLKCKKNGYGRCGK